MAKKATLTASPEEAQQDRPTSFASVIPLNYAEDRVEHTVMYCTNEWEQLVDLLEDPYKFFVARQKEFNPQQGDLPWTMHPPITAILQPGAKVRPNVKWLEALYARKGAQIADDPNSPKRILNLAFRTGAFFAEFATCTGILIIHYWPPAPRETPRFDKKFTPATLGLVSGPNNKPIGTLHFDLEAPEGVKLTRRDHANLIVDCLESRTKMVRGFNNNHLFEHGLVSLTPQGKSVTPPAAPTDLTKSQLSDTLKKAEKPVPATTRFTLKEINKTLKAPRYKFDLPTFVVDGLSGPTEGILCCNAAVFDDGPVIHMGDMIFKLYMSEAERALDCPPPPPPGGGPGSGPGGGTGGEV